MCGACEKDIYAIDLNGVSTNLGDEVGCIRIYNRLINKSDDDYDKDMFPALGCDIQYKGKTVYKSRQHINYCPFCGRKLRGE